MTGIPSLTANNGIRIPQLGFGVFQIALDETSAAASAAIHAGYRLIDTAQGYNNEEGVGAALARVEISRSDLFITTKLANSEQGYDKALAAFDVSAQKLGLDVVDLFLIHWPLPMFDQYVDTWRALEHLQAAGRVRSIGVSNFAVEHLERLLQETDIVPAVNQIELHPEFPQDELRAFHRDHGILTQAWGPLGQGKGLLNHPLLVRLAASKGRTPAQVVLRWHLQIGNLVIPKSVTPQRIRENLDVFDFDLGDDDLQAIGELRTDHRLGPDPRTMDMR